MLAAHTNTLASMEGEGAKSVMTRKRMLTLCVIMIKPPQV